MPIIRLSVVLGVGLLMACAPAQVVRTLVPTPVAGNRIRYAVRPDTSEFVTARVISLDADSLVFERFVPADPEGRWVAGSVATDSIARLQVHIGERRNGGRGALFGALVGGAIGIACASEPGWIVTSEQCLVGYTLIGAGTGLLFGTFNRSDVWAPTVLPKHGRAPGPVAAAPVSTGLRLSIPLWSP